MKRLPIVMTLLALVALSASVAYWVLQLYQPAQRPLASAPRAVAAEPSIDAAAGLFGGQATAAVASNYQLTGVVADGASGVAILVADGGAPKALRIGKEVSPGVTVREVHPRYVMLSENGVMKRVEMAADGKTALSAAPPANVPPPQQQGQPVPQMAPVNPVQTPSTQVPPPPSAPVAQPNPPIQMPSPSHGTSTMPTE